jgi:N utilization substance protein A
VRIHEDTGTAEVIVPDFQLSLAIGKEGQNARLAARLSGWRVDIKSEAQLHEEESGAPVDYAEGEWVKNESGELVFQPAEGGEAISAAAAGYATPAVDAPPDAAPAAAADATDAEAGLAPKAEADGEVPLEVTEGVSDEAPVARDAEEAAMHVEGPEDEVAAAGGEAPVAADETKADDRA